MLRVKKQFDAYNDRRKSPATKHTKYTRIRARKLNTESMWASTREITSDRPQCENTKLKKTDGSRKLYVYLYISLSLYIYIWDYMYTCSRFQFDESNQFDESIQHGDPCDQGFDERLTACKSKTWRIYLSSQIDLNWSNWIELIELIRIVRLIDWI